MNSYTLFDAEAPLVSIIIPTYNRAQYLGPALESALAQTYAHLEIIVLDDCSQDETPDVVAAFQQRDARIRYIRHPENLGLVGNWRAGIEMAEGEFFCILGDDDALAPSFVASLIAPLRAHPDLVLAFCDHWVMDSAGTRLIERSEENTAYWRRDQLQTGYVADSYKTALIDRSIFIGAALFRRRALDPSVLVEETSAFVDVWMLYNTARQGACYYIDERLCTCRWQPGGVSRNWNWRVFGFPGEIYCYRHFLQDEALRAYAPVFRVRLAHSLTTFGNTLLSLGRNAEARACLQEALALHPLTRARAGYALSHLGPLGTLTSQWLRGARRRFGRRNEVPNYPEQSALDLAPSSKRHMPSRTAADPAYADRAVPVA